MTQQIYNTFKEFLELTKADDQLTISDQAVVAAILAHAKITTPVGSNSYIIPYANQPEIEVTWGSDDGYNTNRPDNV